jgi:hypothetical protein
VGGGRRWGGAPAGSCRSRRQVFSVPSPLRFLLLLREHRIAIKAGGDVGGRGGEVVDRVGRASNAAGAAVMGKFKYLPSFRLPLPQLQALE